MKTAAELESLQSIIYIPSQLVEEQVASSKFFWPSPKDTRSADLLKVESRSMVSVYYEITSREMKVPQQSDFATEYLYANKAFLKQLKHFTRETWNALYYRACRAWGTLVSEHQLYALLIESGRYTCKKDVIQDLSGQADIIVINGYGRFVLDVHTDTKLSRQWRDVKARRHESRSALPVLELKLIGSPYTKQVNSSDKKSKIHLFKKEVVDYIDAWRKDNFMPRLFIGRILEADLES